MNHFKECRSAMLRDNIYISVSWFMLNKWKKLVEGKIIERKRGSSVIMVVLQTECLILKKWFSYKVPSKFPKARDNMVFSPKSPKRRGTSLATENPTCRKCWKKHYGE